MNIKKIVASLVLTLVILFAFSQNSPTYSNGWGHGNNCNDKYYYEKHSDYSDNKVYINFSSNDKEITVSAKPGYKIEKVWLDVEDDNKNGFHLYANGSLNDFNPNPGKDIKKAKVEVSKVCNTPTPTPTEEPCPTDEPTGTPVPTATPVDSPTATPSGTVMPTATSAPTDQPVVVATPLSCPENYHLNLQGTACIQFDQAGPAQNNDQPQEAGIGGGQVLGASTMAATGIAADGIFNSIFSLGTLLLSMGIMKNGKKKASA